MPFRVGDRVKEYTVSTGTGGVSLIGAYSGFQKFDDVLTIGDTTYYVIEENDKWEVGIGTYGSNNLERTTVLDSSSGGSKISLGGSGTVSITYPASGAVFTDDLSSVSGWAVTYTDAGDASVSGWAAATFITSDDDSYVSGVAAYASGHNLQSVTDNGASTTNALTVTNNNITASSGLFDALDMTPLAEANYPAHQEGVVFYDVDNHTLSLYNDEADVTLQLGQEEFLRVRNNTGATITNGTAVLITGSHGNAAPTISGAIATSESASQIVGLATHDIEDSSFGYVTTYGIVRNVDTSHCAAGDEIFLSATEVGSGVNISPTIPNYKVTIGHVIRSHSSNGSILVQVGHPKLGGGDLKSETDLNASGIPFVTSIADTTAGGAQTDPLLIFDSGNRQLQIGSGVQILDGEPSNTSNVLYNDGGVLKFDGSAIGGGDVTTSELNYVSGIAVYSSGLAIENESQISSVSGWAESYIDSQDHSAASVSGWAGVYADAGDVAVSGWALSYIDSQDHSAASVSGWAEATFLTADDDTYVSGIAAYASGQAVENEADIAYVSGIAAGGITEIPLSGLQFIKSGSNDEYRIGTTFVDPDGTEQVVRASDFNGGYLRLEVARFSPSVSANGQSRYWDQPVSQWTVTVDNPTDFTTNYVSGVKSPLTSVANGVVTTDVTLYSTSGPSVTPDGGVDWTQTFSTDVDSPIYSSGTGLTGGSASATVSFLDKNQDTISETATISFTWLSASSSISFNNLSGNNFLQLYSSVGYNLTISNLSNSSNASTTITTGQGTLSNSSDDGTMTFTTPIHKDNNSGRTITATTDFTRPATVTGTEYTTQRVVSDSSISASFTYPSFRIFTSSTSNPPSRADIVDTNDFDSSSVTELGDQVKTLSQTINNPESLAQCMWFAVRSSASQPTSFQTGSSSSLLSDVTPTETTVNLEPDSPAAGYVAEGYNLYGITLQPGNTYVSIS